MSIATDFQDLIDTLETNLQSMGVREAVYDPTTGIMALVNMITDIEPSTNIDLDITCTLSSSENSIDYGESIVLTATLLASYDDTSANNVDLKTGEITGATIQFKQGNTVIGTGITNNNGVATLTYTPTTTGTLNITASFNGTINFNRATSTGINVLVNETLTLTSDKTILSAADNESATLTATLHAVNNSGQTVTFEVRKVSDDSLVETLTGTTNSSGVATVSYLGKGTGDLNIKGICGIIFSEIYVEDLLLYRSSVSASETFNIELPPHFEITSTVTKRGTSGTYCHYMTDNYDMGSLRGNGSITVRDNTNGSLIADNNTSIIQLNTPTTLKYEYNNGTHTVTANGQSATGTDNTPLGNFKKMTLTNYTVTDLKIKPL